MPFAANNLVKMHNTRATVPLTTIYWILDCFYYSSDYCFLLKGQQVVKLTELTIFFTPPLRH